jgi:hypothetical protein
MVMAVSMTYTSLFNDISSYLERTDTATLAKIPTFIMLAEQVLASEIKFLGNLTVNQSTMVAGNAVIVKPARWRKTVSMNVTVAGERQPIFLRTYEYMRQYWSDEAQEGVPKYYGDYDYSHWLVAPTPDDTYAFEVMYYEEVQPLDATNQQNWFTQYAPQAMLYGSLLQAMPFLKNDERLPLWQAQYDKIVTQLKTENIQRLGDRQAIAQDS